MTEMRKHFQVPIPTRAVPSPIYVIPIRSVLPDNRYEERRTDLATCGPGMRPRDLYQK